MILGSAIAGRLGDGFGRRICSVTILKGAVVAIVFSFFGLAWMRSHYPALGVTDVTAPAKKVRF